MTGRGHYEVQRALQQQLAQLEAEVAQLDGLLAEHAQRIKEVDAAETLAGAELAAAMLPALTPEAIEGAVRLTGYAPLRQNDPIAARERERATLQARLGEIEAEPRYRDRELLRAPRIGSLVREVDELEEFRAPLVQVWTLSAHPRRDRLLAVGYGTDKYSVGWWRMSYYGDWKAGDELLARFPKHGSFAELRAELVSTRDTLAVYDTRLAELREQIAISEALEREHGERTDALASLEARHLEAAQRLLWGYLRSLGMADLADRLAATPDLAIMYKRLKGMEAKREYLLGLANEQLERPRHELRAAIQKVRRDIAKWARPKMAWQNMPGEQFERRFQDRSERYRKRRERYQQTYHTVYVFDGYQRASLVDDFLWWDLMTDGRLDGDFLPDVHAFHSRHPDYRYQRDPLSSFDDSAAAAATSDDTGSSSSLLDAS